MGTLVEKIKLGRRLIELGRPKGTTVITRKYILLRHLDWGQMAVDALTDLRDRREANHEILRLLWLYFTVHPDMRFHQALINLNIVKPELDQYYIESMNTLQEAWKKFDEIMKI